MGFFSNFFRNPDNQHQKQTSKPNYNEGTNQLYGQLFNQLAGGINSYQYQTQINQTLLIKRQRVGNSNDYIDLLINNVTYYIEMEKEILNILERIFSTKIIPNYNLIETEIIGIQSKKKQQMPSLAQQNKTVYNQKYNSNNQKVEALQFDYAYHSFIHEQLINIIDTLTHTPSLTVQLFRSSAKYNIDTINQYLNTYSNMKLENMIFIGNQQTKFLG
ncbi:hypothetical protein [Bacillus sp. 1NLA3E]|uniref:hypothetical protein n=1 Tax=Bacillus sp. 1NLA3E TaxID=666686 RepID=UPI000247E864|nr:hypothetical protein [Bacillus sp. 1NLA3E]AGK55883.1 hypothetical protein B1NLA3E_20725 [Bacillus sp. 1NLA3E]